MKGIYKSDKGLIRDSNQDWVEVRNYDDGSCLSVVCDGIGGEAGGDVASKEASLAIVDYFENHVNDDVKSLILSSLRYANQEVLKIGRSNESISNLGTTSVVAFVKGNKLHVANIGDSRAYLISEYDIIQITSDHSMVNELLSKGVITPDEAKNSPNKNIITRSIGSLDAKPDYYDRLLNKNEKILLCTDGLTNCVSDGDIKKIINENAPEDSIKILINTANDNGGIDNISVSLIF